MKIKTLKINPNTRIFEKANDKSCKKTEKTYKNKVLKKWHTFPDGVKT